MVGAAGCHRSATVSSSGRLATADSRAVCTEILHHGDHPSDETRGLGRESISTSELMAGMRRRAAVRRGLRRSVRRLWLLLLLLLRRGDLGFLLTRQVELSLLAAGAERSAGEHDRDQDCDPHYRSGAGSGMARPSRSAIQPRTMR